MKVIKPLTFSPFSFGRASEGSNWNEDGDLVWAGIDEPREAFDPVTHSPVGLLIEKEGKNFALQSNGFDTTPWELVGSPTLTEDAATSPEGLGNAWRFTRGTGTQQVRQGVTATFSVSSYIVFSVYAKGVAAGATIRLNLGPISSVFRINPGDYSALSPTAAIRPVGNGYFRCELYLSSPPPLAAFFVSIQGQTGDFYFYGAQVETRPLADGPSATSYIRTSSSTGVRAPDVVVSPSPSVASLNVAENDHPVWSSAVAYNTGNRVQVLGQYHRVYSALANSTNEFPPNSPAQWLDEGSTNPWRMFNMGTGAENQTVATAVDGSIVAELAVSDPVDAIALFNVEGGEVSIEVRDGAGGLVGSHNQALLGLPNDTGWWAFFFGERAPSSVVMYMDFALVTAGTIRITVTGGGGVAKVGKLIVGQQFNVGCAKFGTAVGIIDFSRKERDPFGNNVIVERRYVDKCEYDIQIDTKDAYDIKNFLAGIRATPAVYIGSENHLVTVVFGFFKEFSIILQGPVKSACTIQTEGI